MEKENIEPADDYPPRQRPLRFGVLCDSMVFKEWQALIITSLMEHDIEPALLIVNAQPDDGENMFQKIPRRAGKLLYNIHNSLFLRPAAWEPTNLDYKLKDVPVLTCTPEVVENRQIFRKENVELIENYHLDFILRFGFGVIGGGILNAARYGIWSFQNDDMQQYRGYPAGITEIIQRKPTTTAVMQRLTQQLNRGVVLKKGVFSTLHHAHAAHIDNLYFGVVSWPLEVCRDIYNGRADYLIHPSQTVDEEVFRLPGNVPMLRFLGRLWINKIRHLLHNALCTPVWRVGVVPLPISEFMQQPDIPPVTWLPAPDKGGYYAAPFGFLYDQKLYIISQYFQHHTQKGRLQLFVYNSITLEMERNVTVMEFNVSLSWPSLFQKDGNIYCVPSVNDRNRVELYQFDVQQELFVFERVLMDNIPARNSVLCYHQEKWWLFYTLAPTQDVNLYLASAESLYDEFIEHQGNPVKTDVRNARPAGAIQYVDGELWRPALDCSVSGGGICMNKITWLDSKAFTEELLYTIHAPSAWPAHRAMGTINGVGDFTLVDVRRDAFVTASVFRRFRSHVTVLGDRLRGNLKLRRAAM